MTSGMPPFTMQVFKANEGTSEPFMARMYAGVCELRDHLPTRLRQPFEDRYPLAALEAARERAKAFLAIVDGHRAKLASGDDVSFKPNCAYLPESIDVPLNNEFSAFLPAAARAFKSTQYLTSLLGVDIACLFTSDANFKSGLATLRGRNESELADYLDEVRQAWGDRLTQRRIAVEHHGWTLPRVTYVGVSGGQVEMREPDVDGQPASHFCTEMLEHVIGFVENMVAFSVQRHIRAPCTLAEIPASERDPEFPRRFELVAPVLQPSKRPWRLKYSARRFPEN